MLRATIRTLLPNKNYSPVLKIDESHFGPVWVIHRLKQPLKRVLESHFPCPGLGSLFIVFVDTHEIHLVVILLKV